MWNGLCEVIAKEPAIRHIRLDLSDRLTHGADSEEVLNEYNFDEHNGVDARTSRFCTIFILDQIIDETEVNSIFNFANQMIFWGPVRPTNERKPETGLRNCSYSASPIPQFTVFLIYTTNKPVDPAPRGTLSTGWKTLPMKGFLSAGFTLPYSQGGLPGRPRHCSPPCPSGALSLLSWPRRYAE